MLVVEFALNSPILQSALAAVPGTTVSHEEIYQTADGIVFLFWAAGEDLSAFEDGLAADPTVTNETVLADTQDRRLYRVSFTDRGEEAATFPAWSDLDISFLHSEATKDGWEVRMRMPGRDALESYRELCEEKGFQFSLQAVYDDGGVPKAEARLTPAQQEALTTARELGYFEIPRDASLEDVAAELGISSQSLSERLRRGIPPLIETVLESESE